MYLYVITNGKQTFRYVIIRHCVNIDIILYIYICAVYEPLTMKITNYFKQLFE